MLQEIQFILYNLPNEDANVQVIVRDETLWCTQKAMAKLFDVDRTVISKHLKNAEKVAVMAVTLGIEAERLILKYQHTNMVDAVICDAVLDSIVEKVADDCEEKIKDYARENNLFTNFRFSPGYGDLHLDTQKNLIATLNAEKRIGLTVTDSNILLPRKSVTAVVGLFKEMPLNKPQSCENCNMKDKCNSKKECTKNV